MSIYRQSPAPANTCPRCHEPLIVAESASDVRCCEKCGGVFAGIESSRRIVTMLDRTLLEIGFQAALGKERKKHPARAVTCPECLVEMQRTPIASAVCEVDACPAHGTWFDTGELEDVMRAYSNARKRGVRPPGGPPPDGRTPFGKAETGIPEDGNYSPVAHGLGTVLLTLLAASTSTER
jgi:Zn-finger nucleic acid-binding protein